MIRLWLMVAGISLCGTRAVAQESQVKKAEKALQAFEDGDVSALEDAVRAIEKAAVHKKTASKGSVWVLKGQVLTAVALQDGIPRHEPVDRAVAAWAEARSRGAGIDAMSGDLSRIISASNRAIQDDLEGKRFEQAWHRVVAAMRARTLLQEVDWADDRLESPLLQLSILGAVRTAKLDPARQWFFEWKAMGNEDASVAVQLASALAQKKGIAEALDFLDPLLAERPLDPSLLTRSIEILHAAGETEDAYKRLQRIEQHDEAANAAASLLLGRLYRLIDQDEAAGRAYERALAQNPAAAEAWVPLAQIRIADAKRIAATLADDPPRSTKARRTLATQRTTSLETAASLLETARNAQGASPDRDLLEALADVYADLGRSDDRDAIEKALQSTP